VVRNFVGEQHHHDDHSGISSLAGASRASGRGQIIEPQVCAYLYVKIPRHDADTDAVAVASSWLLAFDFSMLLISKLLFEESNESADELSQ